MIALCTGVHDHHCLHHPGVLHHVYEKKVSYFFDPRKKVENQKEVESLIESPYILYRMVMPDLKESRKSPLALR